MATNKLELAIRDFQYILERSPEDKGINQSLKECREKLQKQMPMPKVEVEAEKPKGFRRVAIAESDSDEDNQNAENQNSQNNLNASDRASQSEQKPASIPTIEEVSSSEQSNWWQKKDSNYADYDSKPKDSTPEDLIKQM